MEQQAAQRNRKQELAVSAATMATGTLIIALLVIGAAAVLIIVGKVEQGGGFREAATVYDLRTPGIILAGLAALLTPVLWLVAKAVEAWAEQ